MFQPVRGTHDLMGDAMRTHRRVIEKSRLLARVYGFEEIMTPLFEFSSVFHRLGLSSDIVSKETYSFTDRGGESLTLRPEGTAGVMRAVISNGLTQSTPLRYFYHGPMFRYDRPQKGRQRQFHHVGAELIGVNSPYGDIEVIQYAHQVLCELDLKDKVTLEINTLGDQASRDAYRQALVTYFEGVKEKLSPESQKRLETNPLRILDSKEACDKEFVREAPLLKEYLTHEAQTFFDKVCVGLMHLKISFKCNPHLVRGLDYYCHTAFEFTTTALGSQSTVLGGGRYDGLSQQLGGPPLAGVGWAAGIERLCLLMEAVTNKRRPVVVIPLEDEAWPFALNILTILRHEHIMTMPVFTAHLSKGLKQANKMQGRAALMMGMNEVMANQVLIKDLDTGLQESISMKDLVMYIQRHFIYNVESF